MVRGAARLCATLLLALFAPIGLAQGDAPLIESRTFEIARQLRCPVCVSESVADSSAQISVQMRELIQEQLEAGRSEAEILAFFQERYGDWILLEPPKRGVHLLVWLLPAVVALAGLALLLMLLRRWSRAGQEAPAVADEDLQKVRRALAEQESK